MQKITELFTDIVTLFLSITIFDILDILLVTIVLYNIIKIIRQTRAFQLVKGIILFGVVLLAVKLLNMQVCSYIMNKLFSDVVLVLLLLFQPEIRQVFESLGRKATKGTRGLLQNESVNSAIDAICKSCSDMSDKKIGALIVLEGDTPLGEILKTGSRIDAVVSKELIENVFYPKAPLHDGAMVIRADRVESAGCILPLTQDVLSSELGTRHRAGVGISEQSDAVVVIVSEETGKISIANKGRLDRNVSPGKLRERLTDYFQANEKEDQSFIKRLFGGKKNG